MEAMEPVGASPDVSTQHLAGRCYASLVEAFRRFGYLTGNGAVEETEGATLIATGVPLAMFNPVFITKKSVDVKTLLAHARTFYAARGAPWQVVVVGEVAESFATVGPAEGLKVGNPVPGMSLVPQVAQVQDAPGLSVQIVADTDALALYNATMTKAFGLPEGLVETLQRPSFLRAPGLMMYLGFMDEQPVTAAMRYCINGITLIFNITTVPEYRKRGLGEAMTWRAILDGKLEGCDAVFLQSSKMGRPLYERMGYRLLMEFWEWQPVPR